MKMSWFIIAFVSMLAFSVVFLLYRKIADLGVSSELLFLYYFGISTIVLFFYLYFNKIPLTVSKNAFVFILIAALLGVIANVLLVNSMKIALNPGYTLAIVAVNTLVVVIASIFVFKSEFGLIKGIGTFLVIIGVVLLGFK